MTRKSLGDKFREAAGMIAEDRTRGLGQCVGFGRPLGYHEYRLMEQAFGFLDFEDDADHRVIALLTCACMADTGDLK